jgi:hypothetical protein
MSNTTRKIFTDVMGGTSRSEYVGQKGELFYDQDSGSIYVSDGVTAGGTAVTSNGGGVTPPRANTIYVDRNRTDTYTQNGALLTPYKTIQAALNVANNDTTIMIAPGAYREHITVPDKDSLVICGSSELNTIIFPTSNSLHTMTWAPNGAAGANVFQMEFKNLAVRSFSNTKQALFVDAVAVNSANGVCCGDKFKITNCDFVGGGDDTNPAVYIRNAGCLDWYDSRCSGGDLTVTDSSCFIMYGGRVGTSTAPNRLNFNWEATDGITNAIGRKYYNVTRASIVYGDLVLSGHPVIDFDDSSYVYGNVVATGLTSYYDGPTSQDLCPSLNLYGRFGRLDSANSGYVTITFPNPDLNGSAYNKVDFSGALINGDVTLTKASYLPADATRGYAWVNGFGKYNSPRANSITVNGYTVLDLKGAIYGQQSVNVASTGYIDRSVVNLPNTVVVTGGASYNIAPKLPVGATYSVSATPNTNINVFVTARADSYFTVNGSANGFADVILHRYN